MLLHSITVGPNSVTLVSRRLRSGTPSCARPLGIVTRFHGSALSIMNLSIMNLFMMTILCYEDYDYLFYMCYVSGGRGGIFGVTVVHRVIRVLREHFLVVDLDNHDHG